MRLLKTLLGSGVALSLLAGSVMTASFVMTPSAAAQSASAKAIVDQAVTAGIVGETASGYLELVSGSASSAITNAMNEINIRRKTVYTQLARQQGVSIDVVAALTGEKQIAKARRGTKIKTQAGAWVTKS